MRHPKDSIRATIAVFLKNCREPAVLEPGGSILPLAGTNFALVFRSEHLVLQTWDGPHSFTRRIIGIRGTIYGRLELIIERFHHRKGQLFVLDLATSSGAKLVRVSTRWRFGERFRLLLCHQFPGWKLAKLSVAATLNRSPAFPRAYLRYGLHAWAAVACPPEGDICAASSFAMEWLDHLRQNQSAAMEGVAFYMPEGRQPSAPLRFLSRESIGVLGRRSSAAERLGAWRAQ